MSDMPKKWFLVHKRTYRKFEIRVYKTSIRWMRFGYKVCLIKPGVPFSSSESSWSNMSMKSNIEDIKDKIDDVWGVGKGEFSHHANPHGLCSPEDVEKYIKPFQDNWW